MKKGLVADIRDLRNHISLWGMTTWTRYGDDARSRAQIARLLETLDNALDVLDEALEEAN